MFVTGFLNLSRRSFGITQTYMSGLIFLGHGGY